MIVLTESNGEDQLLEFPSYILQLVDTAENVQSTKKYRTAGRFREAAALDRAKKRALPRREPKITTVQRQCWYPRPVPTASGKETKNDRPLTTSEVAAKGSQAEAFSAHKRLCEYRTRCEARGARMDPAAFGYFERGSFPNGVPGRPPSEKVLTDQIRCAAADYLIEHRRTELDTARSLCQGIAEADDALGKAKASAREIAASLGRRMSFGVDARTRPEIGDEECRAQLGLAAD